MKVEAIKQSNFLDTNHEYAGSPEELMKYFSERFESFLRPHLHESVGPFSFSSKDTSMQCHVPYPYNLTLTFVFHKGNICTCGTQIGQSFDVSNEELHVLLRDFIAQKSATVGGDI